jgi:catechol 2,3-dioxygenase-like lactoylglutathione lyase family enzyme
MQFSHVGISVVDIDRSIAFYHDLLGMEKLCEVFPFGGDKFEAVMDIPGVQGRMCMIGGGTLRLELFEFAEAAAKNPNHPVSDIGYSHFGIEVEDIAETYEKLREAGVRIHCPVLTFAGGGMQAAYCRDPDGNVFEIMQPGDPALLQPEQ